MTLTRSQAQLLVDLYELSHMDYLELSGQTAPCCGSIGLNGGSYVTADVPPMLTHEACELAKVIRSMGVNDYIISQATEKVK